MSRLKMLFRIAIVLAFTVGAGGIAQAVDVIRIGHIGPTTGWATIFGEGVLNGIKLALAERDNKLNGIPIKIFSEDTKADVEVMTGEIPRDRGRIFIHGRDVTFNPVQHRICMGLGRTYQTSNLFMDMTVRENLFLSIWKRGRPPAGRLATLFKVWTGYVRQCVQVEEVSERVGLKEKLDVQVSELSHGEHRQLELGLTLGHAPTMLLLDEPMAGLSANERAFMTRSRRVGGGQVSLFLGRLMA